MLYETRFAVLNLCLVLLFAACKTSYDLSYEKENEPFYLGNQVTPTHVSSEKKSIIVVSFNIEFAQHIEAAIVLINSDPILKNADILLLQEMDEAGTKKIAYELGMNYIYYPAIFHPKQQKNVGNAILSAYKIDFHKKLKLPHPSLYPSLKKSTNYIFRKTATIAQITIDDIPILFASTHGAAFNPTAKRRDFAEAIAADVDIREASHAVVGGDFNSFGAADIQATIHAFTSSGFYRATKQVGITVAEKKSILKLVPDPAFQLDHLFTKGFEVLSAGKVNQKEVSDHLPIWTELKIKK